MLSPRPALFGFSLLLLWGSARAQYSPPVSCPPVTAPPDAFFEKVRESDREVARQFYKKHIDVKGLPVAASGEVADLALQRTYDLVSRLLAGRPDVLQAMASNGMYLIVIGKDQVLLDVQSHWPGWRLPSRPMAKNSGCSTKSDPLT